MINTKTTRRFPSREKRTSKVRPEVNIPFSHTGITVGPGVVVIVVVVIVVVALSIASYGVSCLDLLPTCLLVLAHLFPLV